MDVAPGTIVVWSDIGCPWATLAVHRLHTARRRLGLDGRVVLEHRCFSLEMANRRPTPWRGVSAEVAVIGAADETAPFRVWRRAPWEWPVTTLPALEAVQAARAQGPQAAEELDLALRRAMFAESRCVSLVHVVVEVAEACERVDAGRLAEDLAAGRARRAVVDQHRSADDEGVKGSPHLFLPDGSDAFNPGIEMHWSGEHGEGFPVIDADDPAVHERLLASAAR